MSLEAGTLTSAKEVVQMSLWPPSRFVAGTDFILWCSRFELYARQVKLTEDQWVSELLSLLEDEPFHVVSQQGLVSSTEYKVLIKCLGDFYAPVKNEMEGQCKFQSKTQKQSEQLLEFVGTLNVLADRAYPKWSTSQCGELLRNQFVQGVCLPSVQLKLMKEMPASLEDVLTMANQIQTVEEAQKRLQILSEQTTATGKRHVSQTGTWGDRKQGGAHQGAICWTRGKSGHLKRNCPSRKSTQKKTPSEMAAVSSSLFVFGYIAGRRTKMLVDTGSAITIVRENVWEEVGV